MAKVVINPVPQACAGINILTCECGKEFTWVEPEENMRIMSVLLNHIQNEHMILLPTFKGQTL